MDKNGISYEIIDYSGITNVKFYTSTDNGSYIPFHWHRAVEIIYIQEGELDVIVESSSHTLHPGDCILINANRQPCLPNLHANRLRCFSFHIVHLSFLPISPSFTPSF